MKARDIIGKKVVAVHQTRFYNSHIGVMDINLKSIDFDDGSSIVFSAFETETEPGVGVTFFKSKKKEIK